MFFKVDINQDGQANPSRSYYVGRGPRPDSAPQCRPMQSQQQSQQQAPQFHQQFQQYNNPAMMNNIYQQSGQPGMAGYNNSPAHMTPGVSPTPSVRMVAQAGMQASPAAATTAPQHFGPSVCHQIPSAQQKPQHHPAIYNNCPVQQQPAVNNAVVHGAVHGPQQPGVQGSNVQQGYQQPNFAGQTGPMNQTGPYHGNFNGNMPCNNTPGMMNPGNGYVMNQCGHMVPTGNGNPAGGFTSPCSPCNGHHHHHQQPVCNGNVGHPPNNSWQQCYPSNNMQPVTGPLMHQQHQQQPMPYQQQQPWNSSMPTAGQQPVTYNSMQMAANNVAMNNYTGYANNPRTMAYNNNNNNQQTATAIQCQDVSQSQDFNRPRTQQSNGQQTNQVGTPAAATTTGGATALAPGNMRPETYQRTLEYVQQCQTWATGTDNVKAASKENKPPQAAEPATKGTEQTATVVVASARALLSPGQDAVSSSTDPQEPAAAAALPLSTGPASNQSNMVVHDMNTSLNSLMQENRYLQMIQ